MSRMMVTPKQEDRRFRHIKPLIETLPAELCLKDRYKPWRIKAELWSTELNITSKIHFFPSLDEDPELKNWCRRVERASGCALLKFRPAGDSGTTTFRLRIIGLKEAVKKALSYVDQGAGFVGGEHTETTEDCLQRFARGAAPVDKLSLEAMRGGGHVEQRTTQIYINQKTFKRILKGDEFGVLAAMAGVTSGGAELTNENRSPWHFRGFEEGIHRARQIIEVLQISKELLPSDLATRIDHFNFVMPPRRSCTDDDSVTPSTPVKGSGDGGTSSPSRNKRPRSNESNGEQAATRMVKKAATVENGEEAVEDV